MEQTENKISIKILIHKLLKLYYQTKIFTKKLQIEKYNNYRVVIN